MRALFVHDHQFFTDGVEVYSDKLPYLVWKRYLSHFSQVSVVARRSLKDQSQGRLPESSGAGVSFQFVPSASNLKSLLTGGGVAVSVIESELMKSDILIARLPSELGLLACRLARRLNKPYIVEVVGCAWDALWNYGSIKARIYAPILFARMREAVSHATYASYVSQEFLQSRYPASKARRSVAVSNVELPVTSEAVLDDRLARLGNHSGRFVIGLIGSLKTRYKGVDLAIEALAGLRAANFDAQLRILGGGSAAPYLQIADEKKVNEYVHFDGLLSDPSSVMAWLDAVDIYIQPSFQEGVPRALIEAMSRGCPAIGSRCGGIPELLPAECLIPIGDARQLLDKLQLAINSEDWRFSQAKQNVERARSYAKNVLDERRNVFLQGVVHDLETGNSRSLL